MTEPHPEISQERMDFEDQLQDTIKALIDRYSEDPPIGPVMAVMAFTDPFNGQRRTHIMSNGNAYEKVQCLSECLGGCIKAAKLLEMQDGVHPGSYINLVIASLGEILRGKNVDAATIKTWKPGT